jgi:hypothetical protein
MYFPGRDTVVDHYVPRLSDGEKGEMRPRSSGHSRWGRLLVANPIGLTPEKTEEPRCPVRTFVGGFNRFDQRGAFRSEIIEKSKRCGPVASGADFKVLL